MNSFGGIKKRRQDLSSKLKQPKGVIKSTVQDLFPFQVPNLQSLSPQIKQYINQLEKEYIQRYNTLVNNRIIYQEIVQNLSTELDQKGVTAPKLSEIYKLIKYPQNKAIQP